MGAGQSFTQARDVPFQYASTMVCWDRLVRCFRRARLEEQYEAIQNEEPIQKEEGSVDWGVATQLGLGSQCPICCDQTRVATHFAPCGHSACEGCWKAWKSTRCMLCNADLGGGVLRAPDSIVPQTYREVVRAEPTDSLEVATNQALAEFVRLKQQLRGVKEALETAISDMQEGADQSDRGAQAAVVAIGAHCVTQQLQELDGVLMGDGGWRACAEKLRGVEHATAMLCEEHQLRGPEEGVCALPRVSVERLEALLQPHGKEACRVWRGQWIAIRLLQQEVLQELLPQALASVSADLDEESALGAVMAVSAMDSAAEVEAKAMEELIETIERASCQLLQEMQPVTGLNMQTVAQLTPESRASLDNMLMQEREWAFNVEVHGTAGSADGAAAG